MAEPLFVCAACDKEYHGDPQHVMTECRVCNRIICKDCVDEFGNCVECQGTEPKDPGAGPKPTN